MRSSALNSAPAFTVLRPSENGIGSLNLSAIPTVAAGTAVGIIQPA